ncbi:hypothetical protein ACUNWD_03650 [Sunxiuqinia sp. A32]|uniref:HU domain-containing protein n=1 Tax=Sunxiuqinia sp. A32 TaxID=3461496 RepID=UPI004046472C
MELLAHIKDLLLLNDCVIIPDFGGFITNYQSAKIRTSTFYPPNKAVGFNQKLKFNDGLFVNHVAEKEGLNYIAAKQKVDLLVKELNYRLTDGERIGIDGVGKLYYNENDQLTFESIADVNYNLESYGLSSFRFETLYAKKLAQKSLSAEEREAVKVIFQKRTLKKVMIGLPLVFALAFFPIKNNKENILKSDLSVLTEMTQTAEPAKKIEVETVAVIEKANVENKYFLIGGSFRSDANAARFLKQKQDEGFEAQNLGVIKGLNYIAIAGFPDIESAKAKKIELKAKSPESGVWIYAIK